MSITDILHADLHFFGPQSINTSHGVCLYPKTDISPFFYLLLHLFCVNNNLWKGYTHVDLLAPTYWYHFRGALVYPSEFLKFVT